eukprot:9166001-Pyramimonas_sp.AAC.1
MGHETVAGRDRRLCFCLRCPLAFVSKTLRILIRTLSSALSFDRGDRVSRPVVVVCTQTSGSRVNPDQW